jgi:RNA binding exosome subunit
MLDIVNISFTTISYVTEENSRVVDALLQCLPEKYRGHKINRLASQSQFGDPIVIYSYDTDDEEEIKNILSYLSAAIPDKNREYLERNFDRKVDLEERSLYLRFNKFKAYMNSIEVTEGGDVIRVVVSYAAYTHDQNTIENVRKTFASYGLVREE